MTAQDNGGPAFPESNPFQDGNGNWHYPFGGMTLRDWFAGQFLACPAVQYCSGNQEDYPKSVATLCYALADAMLAERAKKGGAA